MNNKFLKIFLLLGFSLASCKNNFRHEIITINMSPSSEAFYESIGYSLRNEMNEQYWALTREWIISSCPSLAPMPVISSTGENLIKHSLYNDSFQGMEYVSSFTPLDNEYDKIILYVHGGAYVYGAYSQHTVLCDNYCYQNNALVIAPNYPLAPTYNYKSAYKMLDDIYSLFKDIQKPLIFAGDSAGGGLITGFTLLLKENNQRLPAKMVLSSPWLDLTLSNPEIQSYQEKDRILHSYGLKETGKWWSGEQPNNIEDKIDVSDYRLSPINGDFSYFPSTLLFGSNCEIFYPDLCKFLDILDKEKIHSKFIQMNGFGHVSNIYYNLEEYNLLLNYVHEFISI